MVRDLDALYLNFISGFELTLGTAQALRQGFQRPDLRGPAQPLPRHAARRHAGAPAAPRRGRLARLLRRGPAERGRDAPAVPRPAESRRRTRSAPASSLLIVTLGREGAAYVAAPGFDGCDGGRRRRTGGQAGAAAPPQSASAAAHPHRPHPAPSVDALDPTGCGDVFGAAAAARLFAGDAVEDAHPPRQRHGGAQRGVPRRRRPARHLRGELVTP